jgi:hypothetical protein
MRRKTQTLVRDGLIVALRADAVSTSIADTEGYKRRARKASSSNQDHVSCAVTRLSGQSN